MSYVNLTSCDNSKEKIDQLISEVNEYLLIAQAMAVGIIATVGMILNVFLIAIIVLCKKFHIRTFMLALQILIVDNIYLIFVQLPIIITASSREWVFDEYCILGAAYSFVLTWRWLLILLLTLDRFLTVFYPFHYRRNANRLMIILFVLSFLFTLLCSLFPFFNIGTGCYLFVPQALTCIPHASYCEFDASISILCYLYPTIIYLIVFVGISVPVIMYIAMYIKARQLDRNIPVLGTFEGEQPLPKPPSNLRQAQRRNTVLILFVCLVVLTAMLYVSIILSLFSFTLPHQIVVYFCDNVHFAFPIADAVIISRNEDLKDTIKRMLKHLILCNLRSMIKSP